MRILLSKYLPGLLLALTAISESQAQYDPDFMEARSVRVVASGVGKTRASSGFLWKSRDQVITSLHSVPGGSKVSVECRGVRKPATVLKTLPMADLILLKAPGLPASCQPFTSFEAKKPQPFATLFTFGYHAGAKSGTSRKFEKGHANPERLNTLITGVPLQAIKDFGMPSTNLDIYYVQGGLLPGYSGGPVVDQNKRLVGIVDGGLNKGTSSYNWVIPAKYLDKLMVSASSAIPRQVAQSSDKHFSSGIDEVTEATVVNYEQDGVQHSWVLTKTQSLQELAATADDAEGVDQLLNLFAASAGVTAAEQLVFDIYQEQTEGLIIAVPSGQVMKYENIESPESDDEDYWLTSSPEQMSGGFTGIRFAYADFDVHNDLKEIISPEAEDYFQHLITELLLDCVNPGQTYCQLQPDMMRLIDFGGGNKVLRLGIANFDYQNNPTYFDYYSFAVKNNKPFGAQARISPEGDTGLFQCIGNTQQNCQNTATARVQLSQLISAQLTSFAGLNTGSEQATLQTDFAYDNSWDDTSTWFIPYFEGQEVRFFNTRGYEWRVYFGGEYQVATEISRENGMVVLQAEELFYTLPIAGGQYFYSPPGGEWAPYGSIQPLQQGAVQSDQQ
ncbi:MAG: serine protease [Pseudomonadota bacterium]